MNYKGEVVDDAQKLYAFSRKYGNEEVIVIINRGKQPISFTHERLQQQKYKDVFTKASITQVTVKPMDIVVLVN